MIQDVGRRVVQCACSRSLEWRGEDAVRRAGWTSRWINGADGFAARREWRCPDCGVGPAPAPTCAAVVYEVPHELAHTAVAKGRGGEVRRLLEQLLVVDRPRGEAYVRFLIGVVGEKAAKGWKAWAREQGMEMGEPVKKRAKRPPRAPEARR